ncbi:hypothetical protein JCM11491_001556 [Sporobolomyces phaffii]
MVRRTSATTTGGGGSTRRRRRFRLALSTACACALAVAVSANADHHPPHHKRFPHAPTYDSHVYYVVELDPGHPAARAPEFVARELGAEHVEQVGELRDHYLVRADRHEVDAGEPSWVAFNDDEPPLRSSAWKKRQLHDDEDGRRQRRGGGRDKVLERYDLLKRRGYPGLVKRDDDNDDVPAALGIRSLERQTPRLRVKRDLAVLPPTHPASLLSKLRRRAVLAADFGGGGGGNAVRAVRTTIRQTVGVIAAAAERFGILDPLWPKQWHLVNGVSESNSINVTGVWAEGVFGRGVNVAIVDDGLDLHSDDLAANFHAEGSWDYNDNTALPEPRLSDDQHGTRCAGEIAAVKNDVCGVGVAHGAGIAGIRILSASISDADEASSLNYGYQTNDIYSCSWGPPDDGRSMEAPGRLITKAMLNGVTHGRGGKGSVFVFASGNGGAVDDQCNFDGYTNSLMSITVGAIDRKGLHPFYSEACAANMVVTYSSGSGDNIHTTDVGKNVCTDRHGGTSAAAPIAAGIFALVLEARPDLSWRDLQHLCVRTAVQVNPSDPDWQLTASGRWYNHKYGFGKLDAWAIVDAARTWQLVKPQAWWNSPLARAPTMRGLTTGGSPISSGGVAASLAVSRRDLDRANLERLEHVTVVVFIEHERRGNIEVELMSPRGMKSILARPRRFDEATTGMLGWKFMTVKHWDEDPVGTWTLRVRDRQDNGKTGTFYSWQMQLWGSTIDASKAEPYELPAEEDQYPHDPLNTGETETATAPVAVPTTASASTPTATESDDAALSPTKAYVKPTVHLPDDHAEATGEAHSSFADDAYPTATRVPAGTSGTGDVENPTELAEEEEETALSEQAGSSSSNGGDGSASKEPSGTSLYDQPPGYLAGLSALVGSTTWLFVAFGTIVIFVAGATAFLVLRKRRSKLLGGSRGGGAGGGSGRGAFDFLPQSDFDDDDDDDDFDGDGRGERLPMSAMERGGRGRVRLEDDDDQDVATRGGGRTRELFNAFALDSDGDDDDDDNGDDRNGGRGAGGRRRSEHGRVEPESYPDRAIESFLDEGEDDGTNERQRLTGPTASREDRERRAREEFSD